jgi:hypothetical protein
MFPSATLLNTSWIMTSISSIAGFAISGVYYCLFLGYPVDSIGVSVIIAMPVAVYSAYFCEKKFKLEFL